MPFYVRKNKFLLSFPDPKRFIKQTITLREAHKSCKNNSAKQSFVVIKNAFIHT